MKRRVKNLLLLMKENEKKVGMLYALYAEKFYQSKKFWEKIAREEFIHAQMLSDCDKIRDDKMVEASYSRSAVNYVAKFIDREIRKAREGKIKMIDGINSALRLERSIVEKKSFDMLKPNDGKIQKVMERLNRETQKHVRWLERELNKASQNKK